MRSLILPLALLSSSCIFGGGGSIGTTDDGVRTTDVGLPDDGVSDSGGDDEDTGQIADMREPSDVAVDMSKTDAGGDDMGGERFVYDALPRHNVVFPVATVYTQNEPLDPEAYATIAHLETAWSASVEVVLQSDPLPDPNTTSFAFLSTETILYEDGSDTVLEDFSPQWANPSGIPLVIVASSLMNDTGLQRGSNLNIDNPPVSVALPGDLLTAGLPISSFEVYVDPNEGIGSREELVGDAVAPLRHPADGGGTHATVAYVETGGMLRDGDGNTFDAKNRRVQVGPDEADEYNQWGWWVFDNAVGFATYEELPVDPPFTCALFAALPAPNGGRADIDYRITTRMRRAGCDVLTPGGGNLPNRLDVVVVSPTAPDAAVALIADRPVPILTVFDATGTALQTQGLVTSGSPPGFGDAWTLSTAAPRGLRANYDGNLTVLEEPQTTAVAQRGDLAPGAVVTATVASQSDDVTFFYVPAAGQLHAGTAAGDRVALALTPLHWSNGTAEAFELFDASLQWLLWRASQ